MSEQQSAAPAAQTQTSAPSSPPSSTPPAGEEWKAMTSEQFNARLAKERGLGVAEWIKAQGFTKADEAAALIKAAREKADAEKSELQKAKERLAALEPVEKAHGEQAALIKSYAEQEFAALPDEAKKLVEKQAGDDPAARLRAIAALRESGVLAKLAGPANTRAGGTPPAPSSSQEKKPSEMTPEERRAKERAYLASLPK